MSLAAFDWYVLETINSYTAVDTALLLVEGIENFSIRLDDLQMKVEYRVMGLLE